MLEILPLRDKHVEDAAALVGARYKRLRDQVPALPLRYQDVSVTYPLLRDLTGRVPGVAAMRGSRLAGFLVGFVIPVFRGNRSVFSPEWANGAVLLDSRRVYGEMYAHLAARWVANGCFVHLISTFANDHDAIAGWPWLGFGMVAADAVRDLNPASGSVAEIEVHRASLEDIEAAMVLSEALQRQMAAAPTFLAYDEKFDKAFHKDWLAEPANALWLARNGGEAVACLGHGAANPDACDIINDVKTTSIIRAFTIQPTRGKGVATALLNRALDWARSEGYERCAVDFEPMNILAARFWGRHFAAGILRQYVIPLCVRLMSASPGRTRSGRIAICGERDAELNGVCSYCFPRTRWTGKDGRLQKFLVSSDLRSWKRMATVNVQEQHILASSFLTGEHVILKPLEREDLVHIRKWASDPSIRRLTGEVRPMTKAGAEEFFVRVENDKNRIWFVIVQKKDGRVIGETGLLRMFQDWRTTDLSIIIGEQDAWGKGYGTEAINLLLDYAFGYLAFHRVAIGVVGFNERALRFYKAVGFKREGIQRDGYYHNYQYHDFIMMSLLETEFRELQRANSIQEERGMS